MPPNIDVEPIRTTLPVPLFVQLETSSCFVHPGEVIELSVKAWRATDEPLDGTLLTLVLPDELKPTRGNVETQWNLSNLESTEIFSQTVDVRLVGGAFPFETAVVEIVLRSEATEIFAENQQRVMVGIEARVDEPPASPIAKAQLKEKGLVLRGRYGDVTLLIEAESAEQGTEFIYTDGYLS